MDKRVQKIASLALSGDNEAAQDLIEIFQLQYSNNDEIRKYLVRIYNSKNVDEDIKSKIPSVVGTGFYDLLRGMQFNILKDKAREGNCDDVRNLLEIIQTPSLTNKDFDAANILVKYLLSSDGDKKLKSNIGSLRNDVIYVDVWYEEVEMHENVTYTDAKGNPAGGIIVTKHLEEHRKEYTLVDFILEYHKDEINKISNTK